MSSSGENNLPDGNDKNSTSNLALNETLDLLTPVEENNESLIGSTHAISQPTGPLNYEIYQPNPTNEAVLQQDGAIHSGLRSSLFPAPTAFVDWKTVSFANQALTSPSFPPSFLPYSAVGYAQTSTQAPSQLVPQPMIQNTQPSFLESLSSLACGGSGVGRMKRSISESIVQPQDLSMAVPADYPRKKSLGERTYNSEPPQAPSTFIDSVIDTARTSLYRGVSYHKRDRKWTARTWLKGKMVHIGMYKSEKMAALMVDLKNLEVLGSDCHKKLNFTPLERHTLAKELAQEPRCPLAILHYARD